MCVLYNYRLCHRNITFQLQVNNIGTGCDGSDTVDEGVELSFRTTAGGDWIPVMYYVTSPHSLRNFFLESFNNNFITIRGYRIPVRLVTTSDPIESSVLLCGVTSSGLQLRWLQSVQQNPDIALLDTWALDNVVVSYVDFTMEERIVLEDNFSMTE